VNLKECCELVSLVSTFTFREYNMFAGSWHPFLRLLFRFLTNLHIKPPQMTAW
jgi:hypothetical protein